METVRTARTEIFFHNTLRGAAPVHVIETGSCALVGIEAKASATAHAGDFKGLRKLADACGGGFKLGLVLYDGERAVPFGERLFALPVSCVWG
jgi:uncharacterized protein